MNAVRILRVAAGGDGVGRLEDGRAVFVPRSAPGDLVELTGLRSQRRFARARVARVLEPGPARIEPPCPHYVDDECGGCQLQHLASGAQREARRSIVGDALRRLARLELADPEIEPAEQELEYRTKITLHADARAGTIGLHPLRPRRAGLRAQALPHHRGRAQPPLGHAPDAAPSLSAAARDADAAARPDGRLSCRLSVRPVAPGGRTPAHSGMPSRPTACRRRSGGGRRVARRAASAGGDEPFPATVFEQVHPAMGDRVRAFAVASLGPAAGRRCGISTPASARPRPRWRTPAPRSRAWSRTAGPWPRRRHAAPRRGA